MNPPIPLHLVYSLVHFLEGNTHQKGPDYLFTSHNSPGNIVSLQPAHSLRIAIYHVRLLLSLSYWPTFYYFQSTSEVPSYLSKSHRLFRVFLGVHSVERKRKSLRGKSRKKREGSFVQDGWFQTGTHSRLLNKGPRLQQLECRLSLNCLPNSRLRFKVTSKRQPHSPKKAARGEVLLE